MTVFLFALPTAFPDDGAWGSIHALARDLPAIVFIGVYVTGIFAFPGFAVAVFISLRNRWDDRWSFALAGTVNAIAALVLFGINGQGMFLPGTLMIASLPGGFAGGLAYWLVAGKFLVPRWAPS